MAPKKKKEFVAKNITTDMKMAANDLAVVNSYICKQIIVGQAKILLCPTIFICLWEVLLASTFSASKLAGGHYVTCSVFFGNPNDLQMLIYS